MDFQTARCERFLSSASAFFLFYVNDENGIGGDGEYSGDNDAQLGLINVFYHWASGGMYVPRANLFNLKPRVIVYFVIYLGHN
jgi:tubulin beta